MSTAILHGAGLSRPVASRRPRPRLSIEILDFVRPCALLLAACVLPPLLLPIFAMAALFVLPCLPLLIPMWLFGAAREPALMRTASSSGPARRPRILRGRLWDASDWKQEDGV